MRIPLLGNETEFVACRGSTFADLNGTSMHALSDEEEFDAQAKKACQASNLSFESQQSCHRPKSRIPYRVNEKIMSEL